MLTLLSNTCRSLCLHFPSFNQQTQFHCHPVTKATFKPLGSAGARALDTHQARTHCLPQRQHGRHRHPPTQITALLRKSEEHARCLTGQISHTLSFGSCAREGSSAQPLRSPRQPSPTRGLTAGLSTTHTACLHLSYQAGCTTSPPSYCALSL